MKITAPFDRVEEVKPLIEAGADELYCGVCSRYWKFRGISPNERMGFCSLNSFYELKQSLSISKSYNVPIFLCFNTYLNKGSFESVFKDIAKAIDLGVNGFVIADLDLISFIRKRDNNCKIILSSMNTCFNSKNLEFVREWGIDRVVLDRQLTLKEIEGLSYDAKKMKIELEVFIHNIICRHINANCLLHKIKSNGVLGQSDIWRSIRHMSFMKGFRNFVGLNKFNRFIFTDLSVRLEPCTNVFEAKIIKKMDKDFVEEKQIRRFSLDGDLDPRYCAVCSIYFLEKYGITAGKIIGRGFITQRKIRDVHFVRRYLDEVKSRDLSEHNFLTKCRGLYKETYGQDCNAKQCHHWEIYQQRKNLESVL